MLNWMELLTAAGLAAMLLLISIIDVAVEEFSKIAARRLFENTKTKSAKTLASMMESRAEVILSLNILTSLIVAAGAIFLSGMLGMAIALATTLAAVLLFQHLIPRLLVFRNPETVLLRFLPILKIVHFVMMPFSFLVTAVLHYFHHWDEEIEPEKEDEASEEEIQAFIDAGEEEGILESDEGEMIQSIVHFGDKTAREVMTPRTQIAAIDVSAPVDKLVQLILTERHSRIPVFRDDLDNIEGIVHERDLLRIWRRGEKSENIRSLVKPVNFVPETKAVDELLQEMRDHGDQIVLIVDEYGGISGIITMQDLLEEIVGDIHDGSEADDEKIVEEGNGLYVVPGSLEVSALEEKLGSAFLNGTESTTVAGAVVELFGRLPLAGEKLDHNGFQIEVLGADRRRVNRLRIKTPVPRTMTG